MNYFTNNVTEIFNNLYVTLHVCWLYIYKPVYLFSYAKLF